MGLFNKLAKSLGTKKQSNPARLDVNRFEPPPEPAVHEPAAQPESTSVPKSANGHSAAEPLPTLTPTSAVTSVPAVSPSAPATRTAAAVAPVTEIPDQLFEDSSDEETVQVLVADELDQDLDTAFDSLVDYQVPSGEAVEAKLTQEDQAEVEELFANIASNYARPIKNFMFELKRGTATKDWVEICRPSLQGIRRSAEGMGLKIAARKMVDVETAFSMAQGSENRILGGEIRDLLLSCYEDLSQTMPQAFVVGEDDEQREGIIINALLKQIPNLGHVTVAKLYQAGLSSLETLYLAKKEDLVVATGISEELSEQICNQFKSYREGLEETSRDLEIASQRTRVREMLAELKQEHEGFERAAEAEWSDPVLTAEKRDRRQKRQACLLRINVLLAEMGEIELLNELKKMSFDGRIRRLEEYLRTPYASS